MPRAGREQTAHAVAQSIAARDDILTAVLYGSVLESRFSDHSDVDIAVAADHDLSYDELLDISDELGRATGREVPVRDIRRLEGLILREVLTKGSVVKNNDPDLLGRRIADMLDFTEDWLPTLRAAQQAAISRFAGEK
jgi:predicted nucleotidyltransferase